MQEVLERTPFFQEGPVALVIGCGDMGMGCARAIGGRRPLLVVDIDQGRLDECTAQLRHEGYAALGHVCDISNRDQVAELGTALKRGPGVKVLAHVAALGRMAAGWQQVMDVNLCGAHLIAQAVGPAMVRGGVAIFISSTGSYLTPTDARIESLLDDPLQAGFHEELLEAFGHEPAFQESYNMAKKGLNRLARQLAIDWGPNEVRALSVSPGMIDSTMGRAGGGKMSVRDEAGQVKSVTRSELALKSVPLGRQGTLQEITAVVEFLASDAASYINGIDIPIDGGSIARSRVLGLIEE